MTARDRSPAPRATRVAERRLYAAVAVAALVFLYLVAFVVKNTTSVPISLVVADVHVPLVVLMGASVAIGALAGVGVADVVARRRNRRAAGPTGGSPGG